MLFISEALWLLQDPDGYKSKIMEKGAQKTIEKTVRKLKTEQVNSGGSSLGVEQKEDSTGKRTSRKKFLDSKTYLKDFKNFIYIFKH